MNKRTVKKSDQALQKPLPATQVIPRPIEGEIKKVEELPSVEWGDRINSGKNIARAGKDRGFVPGAMPSK